MNNANIEWDQSQCDVIEASSEKRLLVGASPGTGKTAVACARVSRLIEQIGLEPSRILLISFTRTAVQEIRNRIANHLEDKTAAYAVKITTLDSYAWAIHSGFDEQTKMFHSFEENIQKMLTFVKQNEYVIEYLQELEHLIVDEAQDIVGIRADLVVEIINKLSSSCGVTVFTDEAQAIYGFADKADDREIPVGTIKTPTLSERLRLNQSAPFEGYELTEVHRTDSSQLLTIFSDTRHKVLTTTSETANKLAEINEEIIRLSHGKAPPVDDTDRPVSEDTFILYRRRCDVLLTTSKLMQVDRPHRVRMSGLPVCIAPWIGATLSEHTDADLTQDKFVELWAKKVDGTALAAYEDDEAWNHLVRIAGRTQTIVDMRLLRQRLGRKQPPAEVCHAELGLHGPIVGTIHASKGREADTVHLMLPNRQGSKVDQDEEARVVFVGATRGRSRLLVGQGYHHLADRIEKSGRVYRLLTNYNKSRAQVEIGRDNDIMAEGLASRRFFTSIDAVRTSQEHIRSFADKAAPLIAESHPELSFAYRLRENRGDHYLATLSKNVDSDLFVIAKKIQAKLGGGLRRPPDKIKYLHARGVRTIVLPPDAPEAETLYEPWRSSGIILAPLVLGYSTVFFPYSGKKRRQ